MSTDAYALPLPRPGPDDAAFWAGCRRHELLIQRCDACAGLRYWNAPMCARCNALEATPVRASGRGTIFSYTTTHRAFSPAWQGKVPYTVVVVELEEGPRMTSMLVETRAALRIGQHVEVVFEDVTAEVSLPKFRVI